MEQPAALLFNFYLQHVMDTKNFSFIFSLKRKNTGIMTSFDSIHKEYWFSNGIWSEPVDWPQGGTKVVTMLKKEAKEIVTLLWMRYWYIAEEVRALGHIQISDEIAILLLPYFFFFLTLWIILPHLVLVILKRQQISNCLEGTLQNEFPYIFLAGNVSIHVFKTIY